MLYHSFPRLPKKFLVYKSNKIEPQQKLHVNNNNTPIFQTFYDAEIIQEREARTKTIAMHENKELSHTVDRILEKVNEMYEQSISDHITIM